MSNESNVIIFSLDGVKIFFKSIVIYFTEIPCAHVYKLIKLYSREHV
jgi:hypothetical protein